MRRILTGFLAAVLTLGLLAAGQAEAKVYKMKPEERAAALKEKKDRKARKKTGKSNAAAPGGWVEVKPGTKPERKARKSTTVDENAKPGQKGKKGKKDAVVSAKPEPKSARKSVKKAEPESEKKYGKHERRQAAAKGDRTVSKSYAGETKMRGTGIEVRRSGSKAHRKASAASQTEPTAAAAPARDDLSAYSVLRPGQEKQAAPAAPAANPAGSSAVAPEVRQQVQPGPVDSARPVGTEQKAGEGRF